MITNKLFSIVAITGGLSCLFPAAQAVDFSVFGDVTFQNSDISDENNNFSLGGVDFFAAQQINDNTFAMVELVFENDGDGFIVDLERLWVRHTFSDQFQLAVGRFHSPLGYWNRNLHHGSILQDTVGRPFFLDFEDGDAGILPVHSIGLMANGFVFGDSESLKYEIIISNGPSLDTSGGFSQIEAPELDPNNISDNDSDKSLSARITYHPEDSDWTIGLFTMQNNLGEASNNGLLALGETILEQEIYGLDFRWELDEFDLLTEFFSLQNDDKLTNTGNHTSTAFYIQPGYHFSQDIKLIYRYSNLSFDSDDSYYLLLGTQEQTHHVLTLRYDVDGFNSLKFEFDSLNNQNVLIEDSNTFRIQWSFLIP